MLSVEAIIDVLGAFRVLGYAPGERLLAAVLVAVCKCLDQLSSRSIASFLTSLSLFRYYPGEEGGLLAFHVSPCFF
jgi:hypothetical protein